MPETLRKAVSQAARLGVSFLTVHGSSNLIKAAVNGKGNSGIKLFTVTVLTSLEATDLAEMGYSKTSVEELVLFRARKALEAGCDGVIASGQEAKKIKEFAKNNLLVVTPASGRKAIRKTTRNAGRLPLGQLPLAPIIW